MLCVVRSMRLVSCFDHGGFLHASTDRRNLGCQGEMQGLYAPGKPGKPGKVREKSNPGKVREFCVSSWKNKMLPFFIGRAPCNFTRFHYYRARETRIPPCRMRRLMPPQPRPAPCRQPPIDFIYATTPPRRTTHPVPYLLVRCTDRECSFAPERNSGRDALSRPRSANFVLVRERREEETGGGRLPYSLNDSLVFRYL